MLDYSSPGSRPPPRVRSVGEELFKFTAVATLFVAYGLEGDREKPVDLFFAAGLALWMVIFGIALVRFRRRSGEPISTRWASACLIMLIVSLAWFPLSMRHHHACPHGERWANNQIGIAHSTNGGPCGNGPRARGDHVWQVSGSWYVFVPRQY